MGHISRKGGCGGVGGAIAKRQKIFAELGEKSKKLTQNFLVDEHVLMDVLQELDNDPFS
ncbi:MAG: hypothetical protein WCD18_13945 [Thermosynechococcaceae cyanobacterium]